MSTVELTEEVKLITLLDKNQQFKVTDGVTRFMIHGLGTVDANDLRTIADEIDRRNNLATVENIPALDKNFYIENTGEVDEHRYPVFTKLKIIGRITHLSMMFDTGCVLCRTEDDVVFNVLVGREFFPHKDTLLGLVNQSDVTIVTEVTASHTLRMKSLHHLGIRIPQKVDRHD